MKMMKVYAEAGLFSATELWQNINKNRRFRNMRNCDACK